MLHKVLGECSQQLLLKPFIEVDISHEPSQSLLRTFSCYLGLYRAGLICKFDHHNYIYTEYIYSIMEFSRVMMIYVKWCVSNQRSNLFFPLCCRSSPPISIPVMASSSQRPSSALARGVKITEFTENRVNPDPIVIEDSDIFLEEFLSPRKLVSLSMV